ncbi:MAG: RadC family protein [Planctomycetota bacterium]
MADGVVAEAERPRERLLRAGPDALAPAELLAVLLGTGMRGRSAVEVAHGLLAEVGGLRRLSSALPGEIARVRGVGNARAARIVAAFAMAREADGERLATGTRFRSGADLYRHFRGRLRDLRKEQFWAALLDGKNRVRQEVRISEGSLTASLVHPREVFAPAIRESAAAVAFVHNHPSGDPTPSVEDVEITRRLCHVADLVGIRVLDHVVIGDGQFVSFLERGLMERSS